MISCQDYASWYKKLTGSTGSISTSSACSTNSYETASHACSVFMEAAFTLPGQQKANRRKLGQIGDLLAPGPGNSGKEVGFGFDDQEAGAEKTNDNDKERIALDVPSMSKSASSLAKRDNDPLQRVDNASLTIEDSDESGMEVEAGPSAPPEVNTASTHHLLSPAPLCSSASTSQLPPLDESTHTPTKSRPPIHLATPTSTSPSKKRTFTKAVKHKAAETSMMSFLHLHLCSIPSIPLQLRPIYHPGPVIPTLPKTF